MSTLGDEGKNTEDCDSKGDTIVAATVDVGMEQSSVRRYHRLAKNKEVPVDEISNSSEEIGGKEGQTRSKEECNKDTVEERKEFVEGPSHFSNMKKMINADSTTQSLDPMAIEEETIKRTNDMAEDFNKLQSQVEKLKQKFIRLTRSTIRIIHRSVVTLLEVLKEEVEKKKEGEGPNWVGDSVLNLLLEKWDGIVK